MSIYLVLPSGNVITSNAMETYIRTMSPTITMSLSSGNT